nr:hypothetical protein BaRGS_016629 [Batillaria attramentaria]
MGVIFGVMASASVALNAIFTKKVLPLVDNNVWRLTLYNNINATVLFIPLMIVFGEVGEVMNFPKLDSVQFWNMMLVSGVFGFAIGYVTGTAKACAQTIIACIYFAEVKSGLWWLSNMVVLVGSGGYTEVKRREMKQQHQQITAQVEKQLEMEKQFEKPSDSLEREGPSKSIV